MRYFSLCNLIYLRLLGIFNEFFLCEEREKEWKKWIEVNCSIDHMNWSRSGAGIETYQSSTCKSNRWCTARSRHLLTGCLLYSLRVLFFFVYVSLTKDWRMNKTQCVFLARDAVLSGKKVEMVQLISVRGFFPSR